MFSFLVRVKWTHVHFILDPILKKPLLLAAILIAMVCAWFVYLSVDASRTQTEEAYVPVISVMDILSASDLQAGVKEAVQSGQLSLVDEWLSKALEVGQAAKLSQDDLNYLQSAQSRDYVIFTAKRALFNDAFEVRYLNLEGIDDLKAMYPEAQDLFPKAESLLEKRDSIIMQIASTLSPSSPPNEETIALAKEQWKSRATVTN